MNNKGFTLVELLVMLVVLSILITITVPNIMGIVNENKETVLIDDAVKFLDSAKVKTSIDKDLLPTVENTCSIFRLNYADKGRNVRNGPHGGLYDRNNSIVVVKLVAEENGRYKYQYYVRLIEVNYEGSNPDVYGIKMATAEDVYSGKKRVLSNEPSLNDLEFGITKEVLSKLNVVCDDIVIDKSF